MRKPIMFYRDLVDLFWASTQGPGFRFGSASRNVLPDVSMIRLSCYVAAEHNERRAPESGKVIK